MWIIAIQKVHGKYRTSRTWCQQRPVQHQRRSRYEQRFDVYRSFLLLLLLWQCRAVMRCVRDWCNTKGAHTEAAPWSGATLLLYRPVWPRAKTTSKNTVNAILHHPFLPRDAILMHVWLRVCPFVFLSVCPSYATSYGNLVTLVFWRRWSWWKSNGVNIGKNFQFSTNNSPYLGNDKRNGNHHYRHLFVPQTKRTCHDLKWCAFIIDKQFSNLRIYALAGARDKHEI